MRINEATAIATSKVLLVPYKAHHVPKYHQWMQDPDIQEATASEPLSLEEEYENQESWRTSADKLTFIICEPLTSTAHDHGQIIARRDDSNENMRGDVNFFLYPSDDEEENEDSATSKSLNLVGEIDVMVARTEHRGHGYGEGSVRALLVYLQKHLAGILMEYSKVNGSTLAVEGRIHLKNLMAKIKQSNTGSRALFAKLGFRQHGEINYFGEVTMVMDWTNDGVHGRDEAWHAAEAEYHELQYTYKP